MLGVGDGYAGLGGELPEHSGVPKPQDQYASTSEVAAANAARDARRQAVRAQKRRAGIVSRARGRGRELHPEILDAVIHALDVGHWDNGNGPAFIETMIYEVDLSSLDKDQVFGLCWYIVESPNRLSVLKKEMSLINALDVLNDFRAQRKRISHVR